MINFTHRLISLMATMVKSNICDLTEWVPVPTKDSTITIIDFVLASSNVPFGIFAFLSNLTIIITVLKTPSLQRPSNILLCSLATSDCLVGLVAQPLFVTWWMLIQRVEDYSCLYLQQLTLAALIARMFPTGLSLANLTVISLDRCYALCRPFAYRAKVTKRGNAFSFSRTIFVHCGGKQSKFESSKFIFGSKADRGSKTKEIARDSGMKKVIVPFILGAKYEYQQWAICTMASVYYYEQIPLVFHFNLTCTKKAKP